MRMSACIHKTSLQLLKKKTVSISEMMSTVRETSSSCPCLWQNLLCMFHLVEPFLANSKMSFHHPIYSYYSTSASWQFFFIFYFVIAVVCSFAIFPSIPILIFFRSHPLTKSDFRTLKLTFYPTFFFLRTVDFIRMIFYVSFGLIRVTREEKNFVPMNYLGKRERRVACKK